MKDCAKKAAIENLAAHDPCVGFHRALHPKMKKPVLACYEAAVEVHSATENTGVSGAYGASGSSRRAADPRRKVADSWAGIVMRHLLAQDQLECGSKSIGRCWNRA